MNQWAKVSFRERYLNSTTLLPNGCVRWLKGPPPSARYSGTSIKGKRVLVHRAAYEEFVGPIPHGAVIDHLCANTYCVAPWHLEPVTQETNVHRHHAKQTHCKHGHEFTAENTYMRGNGRNCRACHRERCRRYRNG